MITIASQNYKRTVVYSYQIESGDLDTSGYAEIRNSGTVGTFASATVPAITSATYDIDITVNGTERKLAVALLNTDSWSGICTKIQTALRSATSSTETVAIVGGRIRVSSVTQGATSTILIEAGTTGSGGGDLLTAIDAITGYTPVLVTPVDGREGTLTIDMTDTSSKFSDFIITNVFVRTSANVIKPALKSWYDKTTKILYVTDNEETTELATGDVVTITGMFII